MTFKFAFLTLAFLTCVQLNAQGDSSKHGKIITRDDMVASVIQDFADSLNNYKEIGALPNFIFDHNFDDYAYILWRNQNYPTCVRMLILSKVSNQEVLRVLINNGDERLLKLPDHKNKNIPYYNYSFLDLTNFRLEQLKNGE